MENIYYVLDLNGKIINEFDNYGSAFNYKMSINSELEIICLKDNTLVE